MTPQKIDRRQAQQQVRTAELARLTEVHTYPVTWADDPTRTDLVPLTAAQADGIACLLCGRTGGAMVVAGTVAEIGCCQVFRHEHC